jgi:hypothetical protein
MESCNEDYLFVASDHGFHTEPPALEIQFNPEFLSELGIRVSPNEMMGRRSGGSRVNLGNMPLGLQWQEKIVQAPFLKDRQTGREIFFQVRYPEFSFHGENRSAARKIESHLNQAIEKWNRKKHIFIVKRKGKIVSLSISDKLPAMILHPGHSSGPMPFMVRHGLNSHNKMDAGIFIARGPGIARGRKLPIKSLFDIVPTMLYLKKKPVGKDMNGKVLTEMIDPALLQARPVSFIATYDDQAFLATRKKGHRRVLSQKEEDRLRSLGYLN